ncbi:hypothetical protein [Coleofasciculus chthonoplastes]|uniref:hypothetical protein n=1 Tax=Coleofasciculus chthonoplastes TaxID=64178 RepID=UPI0033025C5D
MNDMSVSSISSVDTPVIERTGSNESSVDDSQAQVGTLPSLLPRSAWNSQIAFLRVAFRAKQALDRVEKEADMLRS